MSRHAAAAIACVFAFGFAPPSMAEPTGPETQNAAESQAEDSALAKAAPAQVSARAAVMVNSYQSDPALKLRRNKGFKSIRRFGTGVYCLQPTGGVKAKQSVASVSVNWIASYGNNILATIAAPSFECTGKEFEVRTFKLIAGAFAASDEVSFTLVVP